MRTVLLSFLLAAGICQAQEWEIGALAGAGFLNTTGITSPTGSGTAGFKPGAAFGFFAGNRMYPKLSGEFRYTYQMSDLKLSSSGSETTFNGVAHVVHYDLLYRFNRVEAKLQPFVAAGGGVKIYRGTGKEAAYQPLNEFAYLTKTQEIKPLLSFGAGFHYPISDRTFLRVEARDYLTPFPKAVITPAPGAKVGAWLNSVVPMVGISHTF